MAKGIHRLTDRQLDRLPAGMHADGGGLYLRVKPSGARTWAFIYQWEGRRREMGFGPVARLALKDARGRAEATRAMVVSGIDPLSQPKPARPGADVTFGQAAEELLDSLETGWKNTKHRQQWRNTLTDHCRPIWKRPVRSIETADVLAVLKPIWTKTPETASRLRGRIERVLDAAKVKGQREGENPARWKGHLQVILPKARRASEVRHHPAMPYAEVPAFIRDLKKRRSTAARALEFLILTAARTGEVLGMTWREVDFDTAIWTVPTDRMKMEVEHRVPLTPAAITVLEAMKVFGCDPDGYVFPGETESGSLSNMAIARLLKRMERIGVTGHGFRSTFRDWVGEETDFPREVAEAALAHQVGNEVERAYRRGDALAKRRELMEAWADYVMV